MEISELRSENRVIDLFCTLVEIPSPSLGEDYVATELATILTSIGAKVYRDDYSNVIARIPGNDKSKKSILLSAHMDVVGDDSPVNIRLTKDGYIETDKQRTLGADDKAGVTAAVETACRLIKDKSFKHGGLEIVFTRDEEQGLTGIKNLDKAELESEYVLVLDSDSLGEVLVSGADYQKITIEVQSLKGGHSGIDIGDESRVNAAKLIADIVSALPQGVYKKTEEGVITSMNLGIIVGGGIDRAVRKISDTDVRPDEYFNTFTSNATTNVINTNAVAVYSLRSSDVKSEKELINKVKDTVKKFVDKYKKQAKIKLTIEQHMQMFEKSKDTKIIEVAEKAGKATKTKVKVASFHAGAETHIYAASKNKFGKKFKPYLIGVADIKNMHSSDEKVEYKSLIRGTEFLYKIITEFNS